MSNMAEVFEQQQTPLHDGGTIPNLTGYAEAQHADNSFPTGEQVFGDTGNDSSGGKPVDITGLRAY